MEGGVAEKVGGVVMSGRTGGVPFLALYLWRKIHNCLLIFFGRERDGSWDKNWWILG